MSTKEIICIKCGKLAKYLSKDSGEPYCADCIPDIRRAEFIEPIIMKSTMNIIKGAKDDEK